MASAKRGVLRWPQSSVAVRMNFLALHVTPRSLESYINATPATRRGTRSARGLLDHVTRLELTGLLEPAGDGATADTVVTALFIPYIVTYIGAYNVTE